MLADNGFAPLTSRVMGPASYYCSNPLQKNLHSKPIHIELLGCCPKRTVQLFAQWSWESALCRKHLTVLDIFLDIWAAFIMRLSSLISSELILIWPLSFLGIAGGRIRTYEAFALAYRASPFDLSGTPANQLSCLLLKHFGNLSFCFCRIASPVAKQACQPHSSSSKQ